MQIVDDYSRILDKTVETFERRGKNVPLSEIFGVGRRKHFQLNMIQTHKLCDLLSSGRVFDVSDDRDRVYALLGMTQNWPQAKQNVASSNILNIVPDYTKNINQVYQHLTKACINLERTLMCLETPEPRSKSLDQPSWVFDLRQKPAYEDNGWYGRSDAPLWIEKDSFLPADVQSLDDSGQLVLSGVLLGIVSGDERRGLRLLTEQLYTPDFEKDFFDTEKGFNYKQQYLIAPDTDESCPIAGCWVPKTASDGDMLVLLNGAYYPFVLRPVNSPNHYLLIGIGGYWTYVLKNTKDAHYPRLKTLEQKLLCRNSKFFSNWMYHAFKSGQKYTNLLQRRPDTEYISLPHFDMATSRWLRHLSRVPKGHRNISEERWLYSNDTIKQFTEVKPCLSGTLAEEDPLLTQQFVLI
ncbi:MAG: hypothetical protein Q9195_006123 [Heterodermia aff. obscurata]